MNDDIYKLIAETQIEEIENRTRETRENKKFLELIACVNQMLEQK